MAAALTAAASSPFELRFAPAGSQRASMMSTMTTKSAMSTSTTKSTLRASNAALIDLLQSVQTELHTHRMLMLDIQSRVSHLEPRVSDLECRPAPLAVEGSSDLEVPRLGAWSNRNSLGPEGRAWLQACQNLARNSNPPLSASECLKTPVRPFSGISQHSRAPVSPPATPPDDMLEDGGSIEGFEPHFDSGSTTDDMLSSYGSYDEKVQLSPVSLVDDPRAGPEIVFVDENRPSISTEADETEWNPEYTRTVEVEVTTPPPPPMIQPAPSPRGSVSAGTLDKSLPDLPVDASPVPNTTGAPRRFYQGKKSLATYEARLKRTTKKNDRERVVLIHFHNRKDLKNAEE